MNGIQKLLIYYVVIVCVSPIYAQTVHEIIQKMDDNRTFDNIQMKMVIKTEDRFGIRNLDMLVSSKGTDLVLIEMQNSQLRGQKILRTDNSIYLYFPDADNLLLLQGSALRQSMFGSDLSYEDLSASRKTLDNYEVQLIDNEAEPEAEQETNQFIITLTVKEGVEVAYPLQKIWVDTKTYVMVKAEYYSLSGRLLKTITMKNILRIPNTKQYMAQKWLIQDALQQRSKTEMIIASIDVTTPLRDDFFSLSNITF